MLKNRLWQRRSNLALIAVLSLSYFLLNWSTVTRAEGFVDPAFQAQWNQTDLAVAKQGANRTYFWGPEPFAHTNEVYAEGPGGQRRVQYFDKARMELTKRPNQDPNYVTNGLLTVELVTGRLQVGDNQFLTRQPATNPVAGDQVGNDLTPTYASFNQGKLAFGVPGHQPAADRTGQNITEAVNRAGAVSSLAQPPVSLKYARYFGETGHNVADVFYNFFQASPLGADKWLSIMGLPIAEPFWAKDKVVVAGQPRDVMIQLFQRRALTYTPSNPAGFQVEMGNIGQHYYVWRYGFDTRDTLPGNYRAIIPQDSSLYSVDVHQPTSRIKLASTPSGKPITKLFAFNEGRAVVGDSDTADGVGLNVYLADLTRARAFKTLTPPAGMSKAELTQAAASQDGRYVAVEFRSSEPAKSVVQLYALDTLPGDNLKINSSTTLWQVNEAIESLPLKFSADAKFIAFGINYFGNNNRTTLNVVDLATQTDQVTTFLNATNRSFNYNWLGRSSTLLYSLIGEESINSKVAGTVSLYDATNGSRTELLSSLNLRYTSPSPDGNVFALAESKLVKDANGYDEQVVGVTFRSVSNPTVALTPERQFADDGNNTSSTRFNGWSADGTYMAVSTDTHGHAGAASASSEILSLLNGQTLRKDFLESNYNSTHLLNLAGPFYTVNAWYKYQGPDNPIPRTITVQNLDGSDSALVFNQPSTLGTQADRSPLWLVQIVQVPRV